MKKTLKIVTVETCIITRLLSVKEKIDYMSSHLAADETADFPSLE